MEKEYFLLRNRNDFLSIIKRNLQEFLSCQEKKSKKTFKIEFRVFTLLTRKSYSIYITSKSGKGKENRFKISSRILFLNEKNQNHYITIFEYIKI